MDLFAERKSFSWGKARRAKFGFNLVTEMMCKISCSFNTHSQLSHHDAHEENLNFKRIILRHNLG